MAAPRMPTVAPAPCLAETPVLDFGHPDIQKHLDWVLNEVEDSPRARAVAIYYAVRDGISYQVFDTDLSPAGLRGSAVSAARKGFCLHKAILFATLCRGAGIPARIAAARVSNHVSSPNLAKLVGGEIFLHWFNEVDLGAGWIKAAPIFNRLLCQIYRIPPLEFDGTGDAFVQGHVGATEMRYLDPPRIFETPSAAELIAHVSAHHPLMVTPHGRIPSEREIARL